MAMRTIRLHRDAPQENSLRARRATGGMCCESEPCPAGMLLSLRRRAAADGCAIIRRRRTTAAGLLPAPEAARLDRLLRPLPARWIGAGKGCDGTAEAITTRR